MKAYPAMIEVLKQRGAGPMIAIEVYGHHAPEIRFYLPVGNEPTIFQPLIEAFR